MAGRPKELRLGLVCYGGSSLSIYMHGITKEIQRLVKASALRGAGANGGSPSESAYSVLLGKLVEETEIPDIRVLVDVIAGTSAGGINGIYLAKALAGNRSQDALRDLWFVRGDMNELVMYRRKFLGISLGWQRKLPLLIARALRRSPLRGQDMARWLHEALSVMDERDPEPDVVESLLPPDHPLDLYVTITDFYGYQRYISLARPGFVTDNRHRHALNFHYESEGDNDFDDNAGLAFAARTTSCFPAVFPPVSLADISKAIGEELTDLRERSFRIYELNDDDPELTYFVDGGVLDNKPFGWAVETIIRRRPAETEVDRRLLYLEPDPARPASVEGGESPTTLRAAIGALTKIPRAEPILDDLLEVQIHNERVERIRDIIETNFDQIASLVEDHVTPEILSETPPEAWPWSSWNNAVHGIAIANAGITYSTYTRLKVSDVIDGFAHSICFICNYPEESNHAQLVRETVRAWGRNKGLFGGGGAAKSDLPCTAENKERPSNPEPYKPTREQVAFLQAFDLGFVRRRIRFVIAAFNWWYRCVGEPSFPPRPDLDDGKAILYAAVEELDALARLEVDDDALPSSKRLAEELREQVVRTFDENRISRFLKKRNGVHGDQYASAYADDMATLFSQAESFLREQLPPIAPGLLRKLTRLTEDWDRRRRRDLVVRYLGFPIWDVVLNPIQTLAQAGEGDAINVIRISPAESELLPAADGMPVEGVKFSHFYAFFDRKARENDYLRGRLDAAEQLIGLLLDTAGSTDSARKWCKTAFEAIIAEETGALTNIPEKLASINAQIAKL
jgi:patatin-related protein